MISEALQDDLSREVFEIFRFIREYPAYSAKQLSEMIGKTSRTIENHIAKLKESGLIIRRGSRLGGYWQIIDRK
ncbi:HTH domain-containing protein [Sphingobacterium sp. UT-1RO-CII-1]|uniref:winged helix-turn-helix transcriptional regulator n=1 Tax=Sphingobacterium sp. UT-1RO-CII-1 TaxID=2995225 RepID=UPI00227A2661|nr:HTH domain-containing protein [Sphingobacterium sp. UT-1RO-CII-1]MCY4779285.1 HTH domain-containing protein [Sphingobacterium sp. UT-1RO-CII-1]